MKNKKVIWMLVLCMSMSLAAPAGVYADSLQTTGAAESVMEETPTETSTEETTVPETETETSQEETSAEETLPDETKPTDSSKEETTKANETTSAEESTTESQSESESSTEESSSEEESTGTNEDLIRQQNIVMPEVTEMAYEFRYSYVEDASQGFLQPNSYIYEATSDEAKRVGYTFEGSVVYVLADQDKEWIYVESGEVRGFVQTGDLLQGDAAAAILQAENATEYEDAWVIATPMYNSAIDYTLTTGIDPVIDKVYAVAAEDVMIYDQKNVYQENATVVGTLAKDGLAYVIADGDSSILYVESGDVRGFVEASSFTLGEDAQKIVEAKAEAQMTTAKESIPVQSNQALHYTIQSVKEPDKEAALRSSIVNFAKQFVGNPYVWGGNDLVNGVDCSGFMQQVHSYFGISLPRVSAEQAQYGMQIPVSAALPGDMIFFAQKGKVVHVAMYIGDNKIVHAAGRKRGIIISGIPSNAVWATRVIGNTK